MGQRKSSAPKRSFFFVLSLLVLIFFGLSCQGKLPSPTALAPSPDASWFLRQKERWSHQVREVNSSIPAERLLAFSATASRLTWLERREESVGLYFSSDFGKTRRLIGEQPLETAFFQVSLSPDGKKALLLREDPALVLPREQAALELWDLETLQPQVVSLQAARDFELAWLSPTRFLAAESDADEIQVWEGDTSLEVASRHPIATVRAKYPRVAVSALYPQGWVLYDRNRPLDTHAWVLKEPEGRAWEEILLPARQIRVLGWWKTELVLLERNSPTSSQLLISSASPGHLLTEELKNARQTASLPVVDFALLADESVYLVESSSWAQELSRFDLESGEREVLSRPPEVRTIHKPRPLGRGGVSALLEGPFFPPSVWQFRFDTGEWNSLLSYPSEGFKAEDYRCQVEPDRVLLAGRTTSSPAAPVLMESYGAFRQTLPPAYDPVRIEWLKRGGLVVLAQLPSVPLGQEKAIALLSQEVHRFPGSPVVFRGRSFGGTLGLLTEISSPGTFRAIWADAALTDLLHYPSLAPGDLWIPEFGDPADSGQRQRLEKLSPLATLSSSLPPVVMSSDRKDRVVDFRHIWSFVQQAEKLGVPNVFLVEQSGGSHGSTGTTWREDLQILDYLWRAAGVVRSDKGRESRGGSFRS